MGKPIRFQYDAIFQQVVAVALEMQFFRIMALTLTKATFLFTYFIWQTGMNQRLDDVKLNMKWIERLDMINNLAPMTPEIRAQLGEDDDKPSDEDSHNEFKQEMNLYVP